MELELPTVQPSSLVYGPAKGDSCVSKTKAKGTTNRGQESSPMVLYGSNFAERKAKLLTINSPKPTCGTRGKHGSNSFENLGNVGILPVFSGPCFRPWSRGKTEKRKKVTEDDCKLQEANVHRFYLNHQRSRSDCFNLTKILSEVSEISRVNENHAKRESVAMTTSSYEILMPGPKRGKESAQEDRLSNSLSTWTVQKKVTPVREEQHLKKLLRGQLISCYDFGPVIEPFDVIVGETLSRKNPKSESDELEVPKSDFPRGKQDIFPFAAPYLQLPLLPSSRNELVRISQVLTKCELFPWKLQNIKMEYKRKRDLKRTVSTQETSPGDNEELTSTTQERDKAALQIFVPASS